jgi:hypothetical protein
MDRGVILEVVGEKRPDRPFHHPFREDLPEILRQEGRGDKLRRLRIDADRLALRVDSLREVAPSDGVLPLKVLRER